MSLSLYIYIYTHNTYIHIYIYIHRYDIADNNYQHIPTHTCAQHVYRQRHLHRQTDMHTQGHVKREYVQRMVISNARTYFLSSVDSMYIGVSPYRLQPKFGKQRSCHAATFSDYNYNISIHPSLPPSLPPSVRPSVRPSIALRYVTLGYATLHYITLH